MSLHNRPAIHNAMWPGLVGKGPDSEPPIDLETMLDLTAAAFASDPQLERFSGRVSDSGEGRWTLDAAIDEAVPAHVLAAALFERFSSRGEAGFQDRVLSALRYQFGGHSEKDGGAEDK